MRLASAFSWLCSGIDPAGLSVQLVVTLGTLALGAWGITYHGMPPWLAPMAFIAGNTIGALIHARWASTDRPLPASVMSTFYARTEALTLAFSALLLEGVSVLAPTLAPEAVLIAASVRLAFEIAAAFVVGHALMTAPAWLADRGLAGDSGARIRIPHRAPRLRVRSRPGRRTPN